MVIKRRKHLFPFRTQQLSYVLAEVVAPQGAARKACRPVNFKKAPERESFLLYSLRMKRVLVVSLAVVAAVVVAQSVANGMGLVINGKPVEGKLLVKDGQSYVPVSALKASGAVATVANGKLSLTWPSGGSMQAAAVEGGVGDWLINGIWRFKVESVTPLEGDRPGWKLKTELRNATKTNGLALAGTGFESLDLVMADSNKLIPANISDIRDPGINQSASISVDLIFYDDDGNGRKPEKLILRLTPDDFTRNYLKGIGAGYTVPDPTFRINLVKKEGGN